MNKEERKAKFLELLELATELETTFLAGNPEKYIPKNNKEDIPKEEV